jgi:hypothetical protein
MGIELYPKFLSLAETRCYQPLCESIVAKCCQLVSVRIAFTQSSVCRWTPKILSERLFPDGYGLSDCNRINAAAILPPLVVSILKGRGGHVKALNGKLTHVFAVQVTRIEVPCMGMCLRNR